MARGDFTVFNESMSLQLDGGWSASDTIKVAICDNTVNPTATTVTPSISDFTEVGTAGSYVLGGTSLGTWGDFVTQSGAATTFDSVVNPTWTKNPANDVDAYWGIVYNDTIASKDAWGFLDLGGPVDMTSADLNIKWNANGLAQMNKA
jgi:hypothetical protein